jgi:hypothetical protein
LLLFNGQQRPECPANPASLPVTCRIVYVRIRITEQFCLSAEGALAPIETNVAKLVEFVEIRQGFGLFFVFQ